jgi:hypothetical protein
VQTHIDLVSADGTYRYALGLAQIHELQTKCGIGIGGLYARVLQGRVTEDVTIGHPAYAAYRVEDLIETLRQGLIGGGTGWVDGVEVKVGPMRANELVERYFLPLPLMELWNLAASVLHAKIDGYTPPDEAPEIKKKPSPKRKRKGG